MPSPSSEPMPVLLIDDNPEDYRTLKRCFTQLNFSNTLMYCGEGEEALQLLKKTSQAQTPVARKLRPGCILLDINMPEMDGREILRAIKSDPILKLTPVVVYSSSKDEQDIQNYYRDGANAYMVKPSNYEGLLKTMASFKSYWGDTTLRPN